MSRIHKALVEVRKWGFFYIIQLELFFLSKKVYIPTSYWQRKRVTTLNLHFFVALNYTQTHDGKVLEIVSDLLA